MEIVIVKEFENWPLFDGVMCRIWWFTF